MKIVVDLEVLITLTYQGAKRVLKKLTIEEIEPLKDAFEEHMMFMYNSISLYGNGDPMCPTVSEREYHIMMKGIKKLEIIYGYITDRLNETSFMDVNRGVDKELKVC